MPREELAATTLADVQAVTSRPGFLRQKLRMSPLSPLRRWFFQLRLMEAEAVKTEATQDAEGVDKALQSCEAVWTADRRCFDVVYREGARVADARDSLLDGGVSSDTREVLSFSTRCSGVVCRVTCLNDGRQTTCTSSELVADLQDELRRLLSAQKPASDAVSFICNALKT